MKLTLGFAPQAGAAGSRRRAPGGVFSSPLLPRWRPWFCPGGALVLLLAFSALRAAAQTAFNESVEPGFARVEPAKDPEWKELLVGLASSRNRQSRFEERRYFPFRRDPVVLSGELRIAPGRGLSLSYLSPAPSVVIVDEQGVLLRNDLGEERAAPADERIRTATATLARLLQLDLAVLAQEFEIHGRRDGSGWSILLRPRQEAVAGIVGRIGLSGVGNEMRRITMGRSPNQRIEIEITEARNGVLFTADTLRRFFR